MTTQGCEKQSEQRSSTNSSLIQKEKIKDLEEFNELIGIIQKKHDERSIQLKERGKKYKNMAKELVERLNKKEQLITELQARVREDDKFKERKAVQIQKVIQSIKIVKEELNEVKNYIIKEGLAFKQIKSELQNVLSQSIATCTAEKSVLSNDSCYLSQPFAKSRYLEESKESCQINAHQEMQSHQDFTQLEGITNATNNMKIENEISSLSSPIESHISLAFQSEKKNESPLLQVPLLHQKCKSEFISPHINLRKHYENKRNEETKLCSTFTWHQTRRNNSSKIPKSYSRESSSCKSDLLRHLKSTKQLFPKKELLSQLQSMITVPKQGSQRCLNSYQSAPIQNYQNTQFSNSLQQLQNYNIISKYALDSRQEQSNQSIFKSKSSNTSLLFPLSSSSSSKDCSKAQTIQSSTQKKSMDSLKYLKRDSSHSAFENSKGRTTQLLESLAKKTLEELKKQSKMKSS